MHRVDINHDGVIQLTEFVAGLVDWKQLQNDTQARALITKGEAACGQERASCAAKQGRVHAPPPPPCPPLHAHALIHSTPPAPATLQWGQWVQMAFDRLDKNGDGWLSLEEIMQQLPDDGSTDAGAWGAAGPGPGPCPPRQGAPECSSNSRRPRRSGARLPACCWQAWAGRGA